MHFPRLAAFLIGVWVACGLFMATVATQNFRSVDRLLASPGSEAAQRIQTLGGRDAARVFLRHQASELNRFYFETWERVQIALGVSLFLVLFLMDASDRVQQVLCLLMLAIVLVARWWVTPQITEIGRAIDWIPPSESNALRSHFWTLHGAYAGGEVLKQLLGLTLAFRLVWRRKGPSGIDQVDPVHNPDHSHVNG
jgi:hypothetical protein